MKVKPEYLDTTYLRPLFTPKVFKTLVREMVTVIKQSGLKPDAIAFTGSSGTMIAPTVAANLGIYSLLIRKPSEKAHSLYRIEGMGRGLSSKTYIILDDLICSGETVRNIRDKVSNHNSTWKLTGCVMYSQESMTVLLPFSECRYFFRNKWGNQTWSEVTHDGSLTLIELKKPKVIVDNPLVTV